MGSKAALHSGCGRGAGPILVQARRSSASSTPGTTRTTGASPLRARAGAMGLAALCPPAARSHANAAGLIRAADRLVVLVPVALTENRRRPSQSQGQRHRSVGICQAVFLPNPLHGQGPLPGLRQSSLSGRLRCDPSSATGTHITSMKMATRVKSMRPSWRRKLGRLAHERRSAMRASPTISLPMMAAISLPIVLMVRMMPSTILPRIDPRTEGDIA